MFFDAGDSDCPADSPLPIFMRLLPFSLLLHRASAMFSSPHLQFGISPQCFFSLSYLFCVGELISEFPRLSEWRISDSGVQSMGVLPGCSTSGSSPDSYRFLPADSFMPLPPPSLRTGRSLSRTRPSSRMNRSV